MIYCALKGSGANGLGLGRCFSHRCSGLKGLFTKIFAPGSLEESAEEVASLQRIAHSISGSPFACLFVSLGSFGTILVIEIPNSMF